MACSAGIGAPHSSQCSSAASRSTVERWASRISPLRHRACDLDLQQSGRRGGALRLDPLDVRRGPRDRLLDRELVSVSAEDGQPLHAPSSRSRTTPSSTPSSSTPPPCATQVRPHLVQRAAHPLARPAPDAARAGAAGARRARPRPARVARARRSATAPRRTCPAAPARARSRSRAARGRERLDLVEQRLDPLDRSSVLPEHRRVHLLDRLAVAEVHVHAARQARVEASGPRA